MMRSMALISSLPTELLLQIYHKLYSIDEVYYLARCSQRLHSIIANHWDLIRIITTIIVRTSILCLHNPNSQQKRSNRHKEDARLNHFIETGRRLSDHHSSTNSPQLQAPAFLRKSFYATDDDLTTDHVWMVVCRWKAVKSIYLDGFTCEKMACCELRRMKPLGNQASHGDCCGSCSSETHIDNKTSFAGRTSNFAEFYERCMEVWLVMEVDELMCTI